MRIQYTSDLHLDDWPISTPFSEFLTPVAELLVLAGDICPVENPIYESFIRWCSRNWKHIILITGNHEYFCKHVPRTMRSIDETIAQICTRMRNVKFLQGGDSIVIGGLRFVGATLWTNIPADVWPHVNGIKGDFRETYTERQNGMGGLTTAADTSALHQQHRHGIAEAIANSKEPVVVVTHHVPSFSLISPEYRWTQFVTTYASESDDLIGAGPILWICGHAHRAGNWTVRDVPCLMNARGYHSQWLERITANYSPEATVSLPVQDYKVPL
jgi:hypothetical protein